MDTPRLTLDHLCEICGVDRAKVNAWIAAGMPWQQPPPAKGRRPRKKFDPKICWFDEAAVADWLESSGLAEEAPARLVATQAEVARELGVTEKTIQTWINVKGCPGKSEWGFYDLDAIQAWYEDQENRTAAGGTEAVETRARHEAERAGIRKRKEQHELDLLEGRLIEAEEPLRYSQQMIAEFRARLEDLPDVALRAVPAKVRGGWKQEQRKAIERYLDECYSHFERELLRWAADMDQRAEDSDGEE